MTKSTEGAHRFAHLNTEAARDGMQTWQAAQQRTRSGGSWAGAYDRTGVTGKR